MKVPSMSLGPGKNQLIMQSLHLQSFLTINCMFQCLLSNSLSRWNVRSFEQTLFRFNAADISKHASLVHCNSSLEALSLSILCFWMQPITNKYSLWSPLLIPLPHNYSKNKKAETSNSEFFLFFYLPDDSYRIFVSNINLQILRCFVNFSIKKKSPK